eukprot:CAMPEP_0117560474 /NCGR_PEP_ID=MMETSP0784-20121206/53894_1 /TAXON_ID=39447 /ORGANISM="" /LENGTH=204 /DNA_ID=CAMNT_0005357883 /DNA_START=80 /DNA_END=694 /DNA_ORIENTATION=+
MVLEAKKKPRAKLLDFGLSRLLTKTAKPLGGTLLWMAPELIMCPDWKPATTADVFSYGRLTFLATVGKLPVDLTRKQILEKARKSEALPMEWPDDWPLPVEAKSTFNACVEVRPQLRPNMVDVYNVLIALHALKAYRCTSEYSLLDGLSSVRKQLDKFSKNGAGAAPKDPRQPADAVGERDDRKAIVSQQRSKGSKASTQTLAL